jgi:hypothetical protein
MNPRVLTPLLVGIGLVMIAAAGRVAPHPPNFVPVAAAALFAGFFFKHRASALLVPLVALAASDFVIGGYDWRVMSVVYAGMSWPIVLRQFLRSPSVLRVASCSLVSSILFFLSSNAAVWAFSPMYAPTAAGLLACYVAALPFLAYTIVGDLSWCSVFFGTYAACNSSVGQGVRGRAATIFGGASSVVIGGAD